MIGSIPFFSRPCPKIYSIWERAEQLFACGHASDACETLRDCANRDETAWSRIRLAMGLLEIGDLPAAIAELNAAKVYAQHQRDDTAIFRCYHLLVKLSLIVGERTEALRFHQQEIAFASELPDGVAWSSFNAARIALSRGDWELAGQYAKIAMDLADESSECAVKAEAWQIWGELAFAKDLQETAYRCFRRAYAFATREPMFVARVTVLTWWSQTCRSLGEVKVADRLGRKATRVSLGFELPRQQMHKIAESKISTSSSRF